MYLSRLSLILSRGITISLIAAAASSFFIFKALESTAWPQPFNIFVGIAFVLAVIKIYLESGGAASFYRKAKKYIVAFGIMLAAVIAGVSADSFYGNTPTMAGLADFLRLAELMILFLLILYQGTDEILFVRKLFPFFLIPLILAPALLIRDINQASSFLTSDFFDGHKLMAWQYNPTSLATFLVIALAFSLAVFFATKLPYYKMHLGLAAAAAFIALTLWTGSRGAILAIPLIFIFVGVTAYRKSDVSLSEIIIPLLLVTAVGFLMLPAQAKLMLLNRFYPGYIESRYELNLQTPPEGIYKRLLSEERLPDFVSAQDRETAWPAFSLFVIKNPQGFGPEYTKWVPASMSLNTTAHNTLLQAGLWGGWIAVAVMAWFIYQTVKEGFYSLKSREYDFVTVGLLTAFLATLILMMLNDFLLSRTFWMLAGMIIAYAQLNRLFQKSY